MKEKGYQLSLKVNPLMGQSRASARDIRALNSPAAFGDYQDETTCAD